MRRKGKGHSRCGSKLPPFQGKIVVTDIDGLGLQLPSGRILGVHSDYVDGLNENDIVKVPRRKNGGTANWEKHKVMERAGV